MSRWKPNPRYATSSHELHAWFAGRERLLGPEAASDHGMDAFWYTMFMRPWPTEDKIGELRGRLLQLLEAEGADQVALDVLRGTLVSRLGSGFEWVVVPARVESGSLSRVTGWPSVACSLGPSLECSAAAFLSTFI